jgi:replicative DNA helicase
VTALGQRHLDGIGRQAGPLRPDYGPNVAYLECDQCKATWVGEIGMPCDWCEKALERMQREKGIDLSWPEPEPLGDPTESTPFPLEALPQWMADHVAQVADELQLTPDLPAMLGLAALSICCARRATVVVQGTWREPLCLYLVVAAAPGEGKSPAVRQMLGCLDRYEKDLVERSAADRDNARIRRMILEKEQAKAVSSGNMAEAMAAADELRAIPEPVAPRLMADDVLPEKLSEMIAEQGGRMALISTEGGVFGLMAGRYNDKTNLDVYLKAWSGDPMRIDRMTRKAAGVVLEPTLTVGLTVQPSVILGLAETPEFAGRGLTARFMYGFPPSRVGFRTMNRAPRIDATIAARYEGSILTLAEQMADGTPDDVVHLDDAALAAYFDWRQDMEDRCRPGSDLHHMVEWVTKLGSSVARLAGLLALADGHAKVDGGTMGRAITIGRWWEAHGRIAFQMWASDIVSARASKVVEWLAANPCETFSMRDVARAFRALTAEDVADALRLLVDRGWIRSIDERPIIAGRRGVPSPEFAPHPDLTCLRNGHVPYVPLSLEDQITSSSSSSESEWEWGVQGHRDMADIRPDHPRWESPVDRPVDEPVDDDEEDPWA